MMARFAPQTRMEFDNTEMTKQAVKAGLGIAFLSGHTVADEVASGERVALRMRGFPILRHWYTVRSLQRQLSPLGQAAWRFLLSDGASFLPDL